MNQVVVNESRQSKASRRFPRRLRVDFRSPQDPEHRIGYTTNISRTGMFVATIKPFPPGTRLEVEIGTKEQTLNLDAVVVHARRVAAVWQKIRPSGMGVRFLAAEPHAETLLDLMAVPAALR